MPANIVQQPLQAVWSFWSKPHRSGRSTEWASEFHHALAWCLSVELARKHYPDTQLMTDDFGAHLLIDQLALPFTRVSTALNTLKAVDPQWWSLGKLVAYAAQDRPFVHIDADAFLWKPLPERVARASVFTQHPEPMAPGQSYQRPEELGYALQTTGGWLPDEWRWFRKAPQQRGECCGILGGNDLEFIHYYATLALSIVKGPENQAGLASLPHKDVTMIAVEQYMIAACVEYQHAHRARHGDVTLANIFASWDELLDPDAADRVGLIHLLSTAKRHAMLMRKLEARVWRDFPQRYARCEAPFKKNGLAN